MKTGRTLGPGIPTPYPYPVWAVEQPRCSPPPKFQQKVVFRTALTSPWAKVGHPTTSDLVLSVLADMYPRVSTFSGSAYKKPSSKQGRCAETKATLNNQTAPRRNQHCTHERERWGTLRVFNSAESPRIRKTTMRATWSQNRHPWKRLLTNHVNNKRVRMVDNSCHA